MKEIQPLFLLLIAGWVVVGVIYIYIWSQRSPKPDSTAISEYYAPSTISPLEIGIAQTEFIPTEKALYLQIHTFKGTCLLLCAVDYQQKIALEQIGNKLVIGNRYHIDLEERYKVKGDKRTKVVIKADLRIIEENAWDDRYIDLERSNDEYNTSSTTP